MRCFKCSKFFAEWKNYLIHLKSGHKLHYTSTVTCTYGSCTSIHKNFSCFSKHFMIHKRKFEANKSAQNLYRCADVGVQDDMGVHEDVRMDGDNCIEEPTSDN